MRHKIPPGGFQHEFLHDVYQTLAAFLNKSKTKTKQNNNKSKRNASTHKFVVCLVFALLVASFVVAAWHNDVVVLAIVANTVCSVFKRLI